MQVVLVTGLSGSGKSVAIRALEDSHFYCVDNLPPSFIPQVISRLTSEGISQIAIAADARTGRDIVDVPQIIRALKANGTDVRILFLDADNETLVTRYSESRRRHPMSARLGEQATVQECVDAEREALEPLRELSSCINTSGLLPNALRRWVLETVEVHSAKLTLIDPAMIKEDAAVQPQLLAALAAPLLVDNMEALAVTQQDGRLIVWMLSDNNFSAMQRSLLLKFALTLPNKKPEAEPAPGFQTL